MTQEWDENFVKESTLSEKNSLFENTATQQSIRGGYIGGGYVDFSKPPVTYIKQSERWCNFMCPETFGRSINLMNIPKYKCFNLVRETILKNFSNKSFYTKDILNIIDTAGISDGDRIRKILHYLVCSGELKKEIETHNKFNIELKKPRYKFSINNASFVFCEFAKINQKGTKKYCSFEWKKGETTRYYKNTDMD